MREAVLIYGAGGMGREVLAHVRTSGADPLAFIDRRAAELGSVDDLVVLDPIMAWQRHGAAQPRVIVATHSTAHSVAALVTELQAAGWSTVQTLWDHCHTTGWAPRRGFWLQPGLDAAAHAVAIARTRAALADATSRTLFDALCRLRFAGDYAGLPAPDSVRQYDPADLPALSAPLHFVDCGAFDGDTLRALGARHRYADLLALEPDAQNLPRLEATVRSLGVGRVVAAAVGDREGTLRFAAGEGAASHLAADGDIEIDVHTLDGLCADMRVNYIKLDIEGAEPAALAGAAATIARERPRLAVSAYHEPEHLWSLAGDILGWDLDYRIYLRSHGHNGFDTVLYALPQ